MMLSTCYDWMSVTFKHDIDILSIIPYRCQLHAVKSPIPVYTHAFEAYPHGAKILYSNDERQGKHLILSGKTLEKIRIAGITMRELYEHFQALNGKFSRVDIALDIIDYKKLTVDDFLDKMPNVQTSLAGYKYIASEDDVETLYVGNMKSKSRKLRIYNKGIEQGLPILWTRVEYEKRRGANNMIDKMMRERQGIQSVIKSVIDFPDWSDWQAVIGAEIADTSRGESVETSELWKDKLNWLVESAAPALANCLFLEAKEHVFDDNFTVEDSVTINTFISALNAQIAGKLKG